MGEPSPPPETTPEAAPETALGLADAEREARRALRADSSTVALADADFTRIPHGLSNVAWQVTTSTGSSCFVRLAAPQAERLGADRRNECRVLGFVASAGIAPAVVRCDPASRLLVTQWVDAASDADAPMVDARLAAVADLLSRLHASPVPTDLRTVDFAVQADALEQAIGASAIPATDAPVTTDAAGAFRSTGSVGSTSSAGAAGVAGPPPRSLAAVATKVFDQLHKTRHRLVLCHHDLQPFNFVWDRKGRPWIVDWEYAGLGDAAFDLASVASQHGLTARARARLLRDYVAAGGVADAGRLELATWAFDYVQWLWYRATLAAPGAVVAGPALVAARAKWLQSSLRVRASRVLRCNNAGFVA